MTARDIERAAAAVRVMVERNYSVQPSHLVWRARGLPAEAVQEMRSPVANPPDMAHLTRRDFVKASAAASAILIAGVPRLARATSSVLPDFGVARASKLFPNDGFIVHSDLHNHTLFSDGAGSAAEAFAKLRAQGFDVAAVTDHAIMGKDAGEACQQRQPCTIAFGISEKTWRETGEAANAANVDGDFVAMRGFEWSTGSLGHANVWFTDDWTDALRSGSLVSAKSIPQAGQVIPVIGPTFAEVTQPVADAAPETATMSGFYEWLAAPADRPILGGGGNGLAGFNHPNLYGDFEGFALDRRAETRIVSCEVLNGYDDYLFWGRSEGKPDPINACLNAGWKVGLLGVTDEHSANFGGFEGKGRGGLWVSSLTRAGVYEALQSRRFFATTERGLRLDASANGARMGGNAPLENGRGSVAFRIDVERPGWQGKTLSLQVLRPGTLHSEVVHVQDIVVPGPDEPPVGFSLPLDRADGDWVVVRLSDPARPADAQADGVLAGLGMGVAYASPWWLTSI